MQFALSKKALLQEAFEQITSSKALISGNYKDVFLRDLTKAVCFFAEGKVPLEFAPYVAGASLFALDKSKGGTFDVHPIASGEIFRRLVSKCLCATNKEDAAAFFLPAGQFGVACPSGTERVIHRTRRVVQATMNQNKADGMHKEHIEHNDDQDFVILKVDLKNAFNKVSRLHILRLVRKHFPGLARWVHWCYGTNEFPYLWFGKHALRSQEGVQQGDPLGPLLFSLVIQEIITAISAECPNLKLNQWYLDDGVIAGCKADVLRAFNVIVNLGPNLGMDLNLSKNELVKFSSSPDPFPREFKRFHRNFDLLGSPIGDEEYCTNFISDFVKKRLNHTLTALATVNDAQVFHALVRLTSSLCRIVHLLRTVPHIFCRNALIFFDSSLRKAFCQGMGLLFDDNAWTQICLPFTLGGFGIRKAVEHAPGAYIASVSRAAFLDSWDVSQAAGLKEAKQDFFRYSGKDKAWLDSQKPISGTVSQQCLSHAVDTNSFDKLTQRLSGSPRDLARLRSVSAPGASSWLGAIPSTNLRQAFDPREYTVLTRLWLGMDLGYVSPSACPFCDGAMDSFGYHALTCKKGGCLGVRHNALRETFIRFCKAAGVSDVERESPGLIEGSNDRPADVLLPTDSSSLFVSNFLSSSPACLDFAVTHSQQPLTLHRAGMKTGAAAADYEARVKIPRYGKACEENGLNFVPMVVETYGAWGPASKPVFSFISKAAAHARLANPDIALGYLQQSLSVTLQRYNALSILKHHVGQDLENIHPMFDPSSQDFEETDSDSEERSNDPLVELCFEVLVDGSIKTHLTTGDPFGSHQDCPQEPDSRLADTPPLGYSHLNAKVRARDLALEAVCVVETRVHRGVFKIPKSRPQSKSSRLVLASTSHVDAGC